MGNFIPVEPEKWAEMVKAAAASDYWRIEAETDHARWLRTLEENEKLRAEVEGLKVDVYRLTEAGNNMWAFAHNCVILGVYPKTAQEKIDIWNAAKKGKKS